MAIVNIRNGKVERTFYQGKGAAIVEEFTKRDGTEGKSYYSAFFDEPHGLTEGDVGNVSGLLSAKLNEYEKDGEIRRNVQITLNSARFEATESAPAGDDSPF